jgi:hypothetical protein
MDGRGFHVEIGVLDAASTAITETVADQHGSALDDLAGGAEAYGHDGLHKAMENFRDRWIDGLDILVKDAKAMGDVLGEAAQAYREADAATAGRLTTDPAERVVDD